MLSMVLISLSSGCVFTVLIGSLASLLDSNRPELRASFAALNPVVDAFYLLMIIYQTIRIVLMERRSEYDALVLLPFIIVMGNSILVRCWRLYVVIHSSETGALYVEMNKTYFPQVPENLERDVLFDVDIESEEFVAGPRDAIIREENGMWADKMYGTARKSRLWVSFSLFTVFGMILPVVTLTLGGTERQKTARWMSYCLISFYVLCCTSFLIKLSYVRNKYSLWNYLARTCCAWIFTCAVSIVFSLLSGDEERHTDDYLRVCFPVVPFFFERIWPLLTSYKRGIAISERTKNVGIEYIVTRNTHGNAEGWKALASYIDEVEPSFDCKENKMLAYGIYFLREYLTNREKIGYRSPDLSEDDIDNDLCGLVILTWMKFLYKRGDFTWEMDLSADSCFTISSPRIQNIKKDIESSLVNMVRESDPIKNRRSQKNAARQLRMLYETVLTDTEKRMLKGFKKSHQFKSVIDSIQRERKDKNER